MTGALKIKVNGSFVPVALGYKGDTGPANTLSIGTVTTGSPGTSASATITGTSPNQTLNLTIPQGTPGVITSVNGYSTASVTLTSADVGAMPDSGGTLNNYSEKTTSVASTATTTLDCSQANTHIVTLTQATTIALANVSTAANTASSISVVLVQDATGGWAVTWPTGTKWQDGVAPVLGTAANSINVVTLMTYNGGTTWLAFLAGRNMS